MVDRAARTPTRCSGVCALSALRAYADAEHANIGGAASQGKIALKGCGARSRLSAWIGVFAAVAIAATEVMGQDSAEIRLSMYGFGAVRVGMTVPQAVAASGWKLGEKRNRPSEGCWYAATEADPGVRFMVEDRRVSRIDLVGGHHVTMSGVRIGDSELHARTIYGDRARVSRHKYLDRGHYLTVLSRDGRFALVLETDGEKIIQIHAGKMPAAQYVEGCG